MSLNQANRIKILLADSDASLRSLLQKYLKLIGYEVFTAENGHEAVDLARRERPDLIILEMVLPELDGLEVCRLLNNDASTHDTLFMFLSAKGGIDDKVSAFEAGAVDYLEKPFSPRELEIRIVVQLRKKLPGLQLPPARADAGQVKSTYRSSKPAPAPPSIKKAKDPFRICGTVLNEKYELTEFAGSGGMGAVYRALNLINKNIVAVKILQPHIVARNPEYAELFEREAKNAQSLEHPHIVKVFDSGKDDDLSYMVMEWVEGHSVEDVLTQGQLPLDRLTNIFKQICSAVAFAHERNIIHLDLKPGNILLVDHSASGDFVKVIDFGLSRVISKESGTTVTKFRGTHQFCSPEQFGGKVSHRSDIYSLGATLYYLLTGVIPFGTSYINAKIHPNLELPAIPSVVRQRNLPPALDRVIRKALNKDPASRQQSALQLFDEFCRAIRRADTADNMDNLFIKLKEIIVDELEIDEREVVPTASIIEDLGADEIDIFELIMKIRDEFNIDVPNEEAATIRTVNDLCNYLRDKITAAIKDGQYYEFSNWVYELERNKGGNYLEVVNSSTFKAEHPSTLSPSEFVDRLIARLGKPLTQTERAQLVAELSANNTVAGRASVLRKIDMKHS